MPPWKSCQALLRRMVLIVIAPSISRIVSPRWLLTDSRMHSPCRTSYRPRPSMSTHIGGQTHLVRLCWPRPHDTHVHCQQILSLVMHLSLPAKGAINHLLLAIHKRFRRGRQRCSRQGRKATQTQLFQLVFAEEGGLDLFQCLLFSGQMRREGMPQASQTNHDRHQGHHDFYETHTCRGEKGTPPTHACIDPHVLRVSYCCAGRSPTRCAWNARRKVVRNCNLFLCQQATRTCQEPRDTPSACSGANGRG